ncbi:MocR-like pyridoxine biosynthesis transcription factor PdxR [Cohnella endophytica]|uniref:MocR-like pyridoxine biosynthesis transcription factor PdxR n=1 Tax=Cohnella endophytica TaxID=2419778 RepID=UPI001313F075|nr:PLP-dependent aminotransferase family protein [Cohnella endophytica]
MTKLLSPFAYSAKLDECGSKHLALYLAVKEAIIEGKLAPGERLPSTRKLAELYDLSRGSVSVAYEMLTAEGFVQAGIGQGTFVTGWEQEQLGITADSEKARSNGEQGYSRAAPALTKWGRRLSELRTLPDRNRLRHSDFPHGEDGQAGISFVPEGVGTDWFPWTEWKAEVAQQWKKTGASWRSDAQATEGSLSLRQAIAARLRRERGIACEAEDIVITAGAMQAIALLSQLLLEEGRTAVIENPCYTGIQRAVRATGARVIAQDVDANGIVPLDWDADLLFVTPTRQFPTGVVLSYERRRALLTWASRRNAWIIEDDYDSDFRWGGRPIEPLKSLDKEGRVVYVGSFSRSMSVGVRIGYAVLPKELLGPFVKAKRLYDPQPTGIAEQLALSNWMSEGGYDRYMRRLRRTYGKLENKLRTGLDTRLGGLFEAAPADAGLHVYAKWKRDEELYAELAEECAKRGAVWLDGMKYENRIGELSVKPAISAVFGFAHLTEERIEKGLSTICHAAQCLGLIDSDEGQGGNVNA